MLQMRDERRRANCELGLRACRTLTALAVVIAAAFFGARHELIDLGRAVLDYK